MHVSTFHALCASLLRLHVGRIPGCKLNGDFTTLDDSDQTDMIKCGYADTERAE